MQSNARSGGLLKIPETSAIAIAAMTPMPNTDHEPTMQLVDAHCDVRKRQERLTERQQTDVSTNSRLSES